MYVLVQTVARQSQPQTTEVQAAPQCCRNICCHRWRSSLSLSPSHCVTLSHTCAPGYFVSRRIRLQQSKKGPVQFVDQVLGAYLIAAHPCGTPPRSSLRVPVDHDRLWQSYPRISRLTDSLGSPHNKTIKSSCCQVVCLLPNRPRMTS